MGAGMSNLRGRNVGGNTVVGRRYPAQLAAMIYEKVDFKLVANTTTKSITFDESAATFAFDGIDFNLGDNDKLTFGDSTDMTLQWDATRLALAALAAGSTFRIGTVALPIDVVLFGRLSVGSSSGSATGSDVFL